MAFLLVLERSQPRRASRFPPARRVLVRHDEIGTHRGEEPGQLPTARRRARQHVHTDAPRFEATQAAGATISPTGSSPRSGEGDLDGPGRDARGRRGHLRRRWRQGPAVEPPRSSALSGSPKMFVNLRAPARSYELTIERREVNGQRVPSCTPAEGLLVNVFALDIRATAKVRAVRSVINPDKLAAPRPRSPTCAACSRNAGPGPRLRANRGGNGVEGVDSNPRRPEDLNGFRGRPIRPLWHPSGATSYRFRPVWRRRTSRAARRPVRRARHGSPAGCGSGGGRRRRCRGWRWPRP